MRKYSWLQLRPAEILPYLVLTMLALGIYGQSLVYDFFIFDDAMHITGNFWIQHVTPGNMWRIWTSSVMAVTYSVWAAIAAVFGTSNPLPFRFFNLILHLCNSFLVISIVRRFLFFLSDDKRMTKDRIDLASFVGGLIFLVHPVHVENVAWISSAKDLLGFFFGIIAFHWYLNRRQDAQGAAVSRGWHSRNNVAWMYGFLILAALSKVSALILLLVFMWLDRAMFKRPFKRMAFEYVPVLLLSVVVVYLHNRNVGVAQATDRFPFVWRIPIVTDAILFYFTKLLVPLEYYFDYGRTPLFVMRSMLSAPVFHMIGEIAVLLLGLGIALSLYSKRLKIVHFSLGFMVLCLIPYSGVTPFVHQNISTVSDRFLYLPSLGLSILAGFLYLRAADRRIIPSLIVIVAVGLTLKAHFQVPVWENSIKCLDYSLSKNPTSYVLHTSMAEALIKENRVEEAKRHRAQAEVLMRAEIGR